MKLTLIFLILTLTSTLCLANGYGEPCNATTPCDRFAALNCDPSTEFCTCLEPTFMVYDVTRLRCVSLTGVQGNCYRRPINGVERLCINDAMCVQRPEDPTGESPEGYCKCIPGFVVNEERYCEKSRLGYGEECDNNDAAKMCEIRSGLTCANETKLCACVAPDFMVWNEEEERCLSLADSTGNCFREPIAGIERPCVPNAECLPRPETPDSPFGYCDCADGFFKYQDRTCGPIQASQSHGQICNSTHYCNVSASLLCDHHQEGICECADPSNMVFDEDSQICRSLANGPGNSCYTAPIGGVLRECVKNAKCEPNPEMIGHGFCVCAEGFVIYEDRTCDVPKFTQGYGDPCNATHSCDRSAILECNNQKGICACVPFSGMVYQESSKACVSLVGQEYNCFLEPIGEVQRNCTENAECLPRPGVDTKIGYCACSEGFVTLGDKTCGVPKFTQAYGENCNLTHSCDRAAIFHCVNGTCACVPNSGMIYEEPSKTCVSLVGQEFSCYLEPINDVQRKCVQNAKCQPRPGVVSKIGYCACTEGFLEYADKTCGVPKFTQGYGQHCNATHNCNRKLILHCDKETQLCACMPNTGMVYQESAGACVSLVGEESNCYLEPIGEVQRKCTENAWCLPRPGVDTKFGYCACVENFVTNKDRTCGIPKSDQKFDQHCNITWTCSFESLLACDEDNEICACAYAEDFHDATRDKCYSPPGGICYMTPILGQKRECPLKAECKAQDNLPPNYGICQCNAGHIPGENGTCVVGVSSTTTITTTRRTTTTSTSTSVGSSTSTTTSPPNDPECETSDNCEENEKCDEETKKCVCKDDFENMQGKCVKKNGGNGMASSVLLLVTCCTILIITQLN